MYVTPGSPGSWIGFGSLVGAGTTISGRLWGCWPVQDGPPTSVAASIAAAKSSLPPHGANSSPSPVPSTNTGTSWPPCQPFAPLPLDMPCLASVFFSLFCFYSFCFCLPRIFQVRSICIYARILASAYRSCHAFKHKYTVILSNSSLMTLFYIVFNNL